MNVIYLYFEDAYIRIPFYGYHDSELLGKLVNSRLGSWDSESQQYILPLKKYDNVLFGKIVSGKPFVEVLREKEHPVMVYGFFSGYDQADEDKEKALDANLGNKTQKDAYFAPGMYASLQDLPENFFSPWDKKLEAELLARKYSVHTRKAYVHYNQALCQWLQKAPASVTNEDIKQFLAFMEKTEKLSASSMNLALSAFKFFYRYVFKADTAKEGHRPRQDKRLPIVLSKSEIVKLLKNERNLKHRLLLMMVYASGLRVSEVVNLKRQDVDLARKALLIISGKGRKDRYTIISDTVAETLKDYYYHYEITDWLFPGADPACHLTIRSAQHICEHALKKANINKNASIHSLRHSFATHLLESGTDICYIKELLGHSSIRTTERYTHVARRKTLNITSPLDTINQGDEDL